MIEKAPVKSKTRRKRDMLEFRHAAELLVNASEHQLASLDNQEIVTAIRQCRKITKGNARKRQIQHIARLIRVKSPDTAETYIGRLDNGSRYQQLQVRTLERWRTQLTSGNPEVFKEIIETCPDADRQQLRHLTRLAIAEQAEMRSPPVHYRKLFQYLQSLQRV
ncbi:MAG: DUF615 domain-containing protein [Gammaproteobacteria bacterium]|nr:DUF615 domain-containing protein [Gammaproteobacteria bacterium]